MSSEIEPEKERRMIRPDELRGDQPLKWSSGTGNSVWDLFDACINGDVETVRRLVDADPALVRCHHNYRKPLYFAVRENQLEVVGFLLDRDPDPTNLAVNDSVLDICDDRGYVEMRQLIEDKLAALHNASTRGEEIAAAIRARDLNKVREMLDKDPSLIDAGDARSNQPIHWATMSRQPEMIDELLARGADIDSQRQDGARPIQLTNGDYGYRGWRDVPSEIAPPPGEVLDYLIARGAYFDISTAANIGNVDRVKELLDENPLLANQQADYVSYYQGSGAPLKNAAAAGHKEMVELLLKYGADPNQREEGIAPDGHALYSAVYNGHYEIAKLLLEHGAFPNPEVESSADALSIALVRSDRKMVDLLVSHGAKWDIPMRLREITYDEILRKGKPERTMRVLAAFDDRTTAEAVLKENPELADDPEALSTAAGSGHEEFVRLLLRYKPDVAKKVSANAATQAISRLLVEHGADPSKPDWLGVTPLHELAYRGDVEKAARLIDLGANLDARDEDICSTPLGWAAKFGRKLMVELLLRRGAAIELSDDPPWATPLAWANRRGHHEIVELLQRFKTDGTLPSTSIEEYEGLAADLREACGTGNAGAIERLKGHFRLERAPTQAEIQGRVGERLGKSRDEMINSGLSLDEARRVISRLSGFESWEQLSAHVAN